MLFFLLLLNTAKLQQGADVLYLRCGAVKSKRKFWLGSIAIPPAAILPARSLLAMASGPLSTEAGRLGSVAPFCAFVVSEAALRLVPFACTTLG